MSPKGCPQRSHRGNGWPKKRDDDPQELLGIRVPLELALVVIPSPGARSLRFRINRRRILQLGIDVLVFRVPMSASAFAFLLLRSDFSPALPSFSSRRRSTHRMSRRRRGCRNSPFSSYCRQKDATKCLRGIMGKVRVRATHHPCPATMPDESAPEPQIGRAHV